MPGDLTGLLGVRHAHVARWLVTAGIENTRDLLSLDEEARRFTVGMGMPRWAKVAEALPPGVKLGCLAERAPPQPQAQPPALRVVGGVDVEPIEDSNPARRLAAKLRRQNAACT